MHNKVKIICHDLKPDGTEYGEFWQEPAVHLKGCSHPQKAIDRNSEKRRYSTEDFIKKAMIVHDSDDYDYSLVDYTSSKTKIKVICKKCGTNGKMHGVFETSPDLFLMGKGCPKCGNHASVAEDEICDFISSNLDNVNIVRRSHKVIKGEEIDIYLPDYNLGIEYNGIRWHSEQFNKDKNYHLEKTLKCKEKGITLIHIFEDEWIENKKLVLEKIGHFLKMFKKETAPGRKCIVKKVSGPEVKQFLNTYHIQGSAGYTVAYGAFYNDELVAVMTFLNNGGWELNRFCTNTDYNCPGVASKIFTHFVKEYNPDSVKSFLDRRWCFDEENNLYTKLGFKQDAILPPDYRYTNGHGERLHKFGFRKQVLHKKYGLPLTMTETEMTKSLGYYKIWDCGLIRYVWRNAAKTNKKS
jgi:very-short-patch-repair endonuclease